jgi:hypothetical protein
MNANVFRAILAMDSYNRGYRAGVSDLPVLLNQTRIGTATIIDDSTNALGLITTRQAGFYATAYSWNGETVISYRGTNINQVEILAEIASLPSLSDVFNGWSLGLGYPAGSQAQLALRFYEAVAGVGSVYQPASEITLLGHSLGGGLAGFVGSLAHQTNIYGYDHMPFGVAAYAQAIAGITVTVHLILPLKRAFQK